MSGLFSSASCDTARGAFFSEEPPRIDPLQEKKSRTEESVKAETLGANVSKRIFQTTSNEPINSGDLKKSRVSNHEFTLKPEKIADFDFDSLRDGGDDEDEGDLKQNPSKNAIPEKDSALKSQSSENLQIDQALQEFQLDQALQALNSSIKTYNDYKKGILEGKKSVQIQIFNKCKYVSENDFNILDIIKKIAPQCLQEAKIWISGASKNYKFADSTLAFMSQASLYCLIHYHENQLAKHLELYQKFNEENEETFSSGEHEVLQTLKKKIEDFHEQLEKDKHLASEEGLIKFADVICKTAPLKKIATSLPEKISGKICKSFFKIFKNLWVIGNVKNASVFQEEALFDLKSRIVVNIYSDSKDPKQKETKLKLEEQKQELIKDVDNFLKALCKCKSIDELKVILKKYGIPFNIPCTITEPEILIKNPRFIRQMIRSYLFWTGNTQSFMETEKKNILSSMKEEHEKRVDEALIPVNQHIQQCKSLSWPEIKAHFAHIHVNIDTIELSAEENPEKLLIPPTSKSEWDDCIQNPNFCIALAEKWVQHQETTAILSKQAVTQLLLSKHEVEKKSLFFRRTEHIVSIISNVIQLALCHQAARLFILSSSFLGSALELMFIDLYKFQVPGTGVLYACYPLYPKITFKLEAMIMLLIKHFYFLRMKPHEYSLESYKLTLETNMLECIQTLRSLLFSTKRILLWIQINVIENRVFSKTKKTLHEDKRYIGMMHQYQQKYLDCQASIKKLKKSLKNLKLDDAKLIVQPSAGIHPTSNAFKDIGDAMKEVDVDFFPAQVKELFENHLIDYSEENPTSFKLTNESKVNVQGNLEKLFTETEFEFVKTFDDNRFAYLKV